MKVNDPNLSALPPLAGSTANLTANRTVRPQGIDPGVDGARVGGASSPGTGDDVHLSELVRSLRSLAADSPDRQARLEQIARSYANGVYHVDAQATASGIIDDSLKP